MWLPNAKLSGERLLAAEKILIVGVSRYALNHDDFHNPRARPLRRLVRQPILEAGLLLYRTEA